MLLLEVFQEPEVLRLDREVEAGRRLIRDQQGGAAMAMAPTARWRMPPESGNGAAGMTGEADAAGGEQRCGALGQALPRRGVVRRRPRAPGADREHRFSELTGPVGSSRPCGPDLLHLTFRLREQIIAVEEDLPAEDRAPAAGRGDQRRRRTLPEPDSPQTPSPRSSTVKGTPSTA
jgi:hypothetical protein